MNRIKYIVSLALLLTLSSAIDFRDTNTDLNDKGTLLTISDFFNKQQANYFFYSDNRIRAYSFNGKSLFESDPLPAAVENIQIRDIFGDGLPVILATFVANNGLNEMALLHRNGSVQMLPLKAQGVPLVADLEGIGSTALIYACEAFAEGCVVKISEKSFSSEESLQKYYKDVKPLATPFNAILADMDGSCTANFVSVVKNEENLELQILGSNSKYFAISNNSPLVPSDLVAKASLDLIQLLNDEIFISKNSQREICKSTFNSDGCTPYNDLCYADPSYSLETFSEPLNGFNGKDFVVAYLGLKNRPFVIYTTDKGVSLLQFKSDWSIDRDELSLDFSVEKIVPFYESGETYLALQTASDIKFLKYRNREPGCYAQVSVLESICPVNAAKCPAKLDYSADYPYGALKAASAKLYGVSFADNRRVAIEIAQNWSPRFSGSIYTPMGKMNYISSVCYSSKCWMNVMPSSKLYILPYPESNPKQWRMKAELPFRWYSVSVAVIVMTCLLVVGVSIYIILARKEMQEDRREAATVARLFAHK